MVNATLSYRLRGDQRYTFYVRGNNLLGEEVFNHSSFLASTVPEPGRNVTVGTRIEFCRNVNGICAGALTPPDTTTRIWRTPCNA